MRQQHGVWRQYGHRYHATVDVAEFDALARHIREELPTLLAPSRASWQLVGQASLGNWWTACSGDQRGVTVLPGHDVRAERSRLVPPSG
ncbi:MAG: hypothetical protein ACRDRL_33750 [Sciscionella sp.]